MSEKPEAIVFHQVLREGGGYDVYLGKGRYWPSVIEITSELLDTTPASPVLYLEGDLLSISVKNGHAAYRLAGVDFLRLTRVGTCEQSYLDPNIAVPD